MDYIMWVRSLEKLRKFNECLGVLAAVYYNILCNYTLWYVQVITDILVPKGLATFGRIDILYKK